MKSQLTHDIHMRRAEIGDAALIAENLRECDRLEIEASTPMNPSESIAQSIAASAACWTAVKDGAPIAVLGVTPISIMRGIGSPWLIGTMECDRVFVPFVRLTRTYIPIMHSLFPVLENMVDARNVKSIRWLKRLGFVFGDAVEHSYSGMAFYPFSMRLSDV